MEKEMDFTEELDMDASQEEIDASIKKVNERHNVTKRGTINQQKFVVSIPKPILTEIISPNKELTKTDLRMIILLLSKLNAYDHNKKSSQSTACTFTHISEDQVAEHLEIKVKKVRKSLNHLVDLEILEFGSDAVTDNGYRFVL